MLVVHDGKNAVHAVAQPVQVILFQLGADLGSDVAFHSVKEMVGRGEQVGKFKDIEIVHVCAAEGAGHNGHLIRTHDSAFDGIAVTAQLRAVIRLDLIAAVSSGLYFFLYLEDQVINHVLAIHQAGGSADLPNVGIFLGSTDSFGVCVLIIGAGRVIAAAHQQCQRHGHRQEQSDILFHSELLMYI